MFLIILIFLEFNFLIFVLFFLKKDFIFIWFFLFNKLSFLFNLFLELILGNGILKYISMLFVLVL